MKRSVHSCSLVILISSHIIARGIERRKMFWNDADGDFFVNRLGKVLIETHTDFFAWAMIPFIRQPVNLASAP